VPGGVVEAVAHEEHVALAVGGDDDLDVVAPLVPDELDLALLARHHVGCRGVLVGPRVLRGPGHRGVRRGGLALGHQLEEALEDVAIQTMGHGVLAGYGDYPSHARKVRAADSSLASWRRSQ